MKRNRMTVLVAGMLIQFCAGIIYMWSVFKDPVAAYLKWDVDAAAFTSSVMLSGFVLGILFGGRAQDAIGPRPVTITGSILISAGMLATSFVTASMPGLVYVTYGILGGLGVGCVYTCTVSTVQKWFPDKRGFASGMIVAAFGCSLVVFAPLASWMLTKWGVPTVFRVFGLAFLVICLLCAQLITLPQAAGTATAATAKKQYTTIEMLKSKQFYLIAGSMFFLLPAYFILNPLLKSLGVERGLSESAALVSVMITGICSAVGRLLISWISDKTGRKAAMLFAAGVMLVSGLLMTVAQGAMFLVCVGAIAFAFGGSSGVYAAVTSDHFGTKYAGANFGCVMLAFGLSALVSPLVANQLRAGGGYASSFIMAAITSGISLVLILLLDKEPDKADRVK